MTLLNLIELELAVVSLFVGMLSGILVFVFLTIAKATVTKRKQDQ